MKTILFLLLIPFLMYGDYKELLFNGNCVTCHSTNNLNKSAPTIIEIQKSYKNAFPNKKEFIEYMSTWVYNPKVETSIMSDSINKYSLMPNLAYDKDTLKEISTYIYEKDFTKQ